MSVICKGSDDCELVAAQRRARKRVEKTLVATAAFELEVMRVAREGGRTKELLDSFQRLDSLTALGCFADSGLSQKTIIKLAEIDDQAREWVAESKLDNGF